MELLIICGVALLAAGVFGDPDFAPVAFTLGIFVLIMAAVIALLS